MSVKAVLFDLDGTLIDRHLKPSKTLHEILKQKGIRVSAEKIERASLEVIRELRDTFEDQRGKIPHSELYHIWKSTFLRVLGMEDSIGNLSRLIDLQWMDVSDTKVYPDVIPILTDLKCRGIKTGIVSDAYEKEIQEILEIVDLDEKLFDVIVGPDTTRKAKPEPEAFTHTLRALGIEPREAIFVGDDLERDYRAAEKIGMCPFLIMRSEETCVIEDVRQVRSLMSLLDYLD